MSMTARMNVSLLTEEQRRKVLGLDKFDKMTAGIDKIVSAVKEGEVDPLKVKICFKRMIDALESADKEISDEVMNECEKYDSKTFEVFGAKFSLTSRTKYDYSAVNAWKGKQNVIDENRDAQKRIEAQLKAATIESPYLDATTGEYVTSIPTEITRSVSVTIPKTKAK